MIAIVLSALLAIAPPAFSDLASGLGVVPKDLTIKGKPVDAVKWTDRLGLNLVVLTETARVGEASGGTKSIYGYHFVRDGERWKQLWRVADAVTDCDFDLTLEFVGSLAVTDLDGNGTAETTFAYIGSCRSDVSPDALKVLMHEADRKYALRGTARIEDGRDARGRPTFSGGDRKADPSFARAPRAFLAHAQKVFDASGGK